MEQANGGRVTAPEDGASAGPPAPDTPRSEPERWRHDTLRGLGTALSAELDPERLTELMSDQATALVGADFGGFMGTGRDPVSGRPTRLVLAGIAPDAFGALSAPAGSALVDPCFAARRTVRVDDVRDDPRYGRHDPDRALPAGLPQVVSLLAVPVISPLGELLGGLFFAHRAPRAFSDEHARLVEAIALQAAVALENASLYQKARGAELRKDELLSLLAHELRNPLAPIRYAVHLLSRTGPSGPHAARSLEVISRQVERLALLLDGLLDVARIGRGQVELEREDLDLVGVLARATAAAAPLVEERGHVLESALPAEPIRLWADSARLEQVVANLLDNAARYTQPGGCLGLTAAQEDGAAIVRVRDNGVGLPPAVTASIGGQAQGAWDRSKGALGLGLTLVRDLVALHGGTVQASSGEAGQGSEVVVRLPLDARAGPARPRVARRVLVVDADVDAAQSLAVALQGLEHEVRTAHDGPHALAMARVFEPEVVLLDLRLAERDGFEVARRLRSDAGARRPHLVALTDSGDAASSQRAREAGFDRDVPRPTDVRRLAERVGEWGS